MTDASTWCKVMHMANKIRGSKGTKRSSISFSQDTYSSLEEIAFEKKVSLAWLVREAVEIYLKGQKEGKNVKSV